MQKHFTVECPECGHNIVLRVNVEFGDAIINDALRGLDLSNLQVTATYYESIGNSIHEFGLDEIPESAAPSAPSAHAEPNVNVSVEVVPESSEEEIDNVVAAIQSGGYVPNGHLFRRWIMALDYHAEQCNGGITAWIHAKGYEYMWKSAIHELDVTLKIRERDPENYVERIRFMHDGTFVAMAKDYVEQLREFIRNLHTHTCDGKQYVRLPRQRGKSYLHDGRDIFKSRIENDIFMPLEKLISKMERSSGSYRTFVDTVKEFNKKRIVIKSFTQCREWIDAYKAIGAYYTLKNGILFHNFTLIDASEQRLTGNAALEYLRAKADEYSHPDEDGHEQGYKLYGLKREAIDYNHFDFEERMHALGVR